MFIRHPVWLVASLPMVLAACGSSDDTPEEPAATASTTPPALALRIERTGGFAGPGVPFGHIPALSAYADGRVISPGPQIDVYPPPALPSIQIQQIGPPAVTRLAENAVSAGVRTATDFGDPHVADATTTTVTAVTSSGVHRVMVKALGEASPGDPDLTEEQRSARNALRAFIERATALPGAASPTRYQASAIAALATPYVAPEQDLRSLPAARPWPGPRLPGDPGTGCLVVTGDAADRVRAAAVDATVITPWRSGGDTWNITFRPLLPDEHTCADLPAHSTRQGPSTPTVAATTSRPN